MEEECFGGEQVTTHYNSTWPTKTARLKNAYMLFYQRKVPEPEEFPVPDIIQRPTLALEKKAATITSATPTTSLSQEEKEQQEKKEQRQEKGKEKVAEGDSSSSAFALPSSLVGEDYFRSVFTELVPDDVLEEIWQKNHSVTRHRQLFEAPYISFMRDVLSLVTLDKRISGIPFFPPLVSVAFFDC